MEKRFIDMAKDQILKNDKLIPFELTEEDLQTLAEFYALWFYADMSDDYSRTKEEQRVLSKKMKNYLRQRAGWENADNDQVNQLYYFFTNYYF
jgi:hypothetical protein